MKFILCNTVLISRQTRKSYRY